MIPEIRGAEVGAERREGGECEAGVAGVAERERVVAPRIAGV